jgi:hypothetical protein
VATVVTAGRLYSAGCPLGHFGHVFIDEAGHATEPESLMAMAGTERPLMWCSQDRGPIFRTFFPGKFHFFPTFFGGKVFRGIFPEIFPRKNVRKIIPTGGLWFLMSFAIFNHSVEQ